MPMAWDVIVIGVGSMGSATCYNLAKRGVRVLGLEQGPLPNPMASFAGATRAIRLSYTEHPDYVPLLRGAYELWDELGTVTGHEYLKRTGAVYLGSPDGYLVGGARQAAEEHGLKHTIFSADEFRERWPQFQLPEGFVGMHEEEAGYLLSEQAIAAFIEQALRAGADLRGHESVIDWHPEGEGVMVRTAREEYCAGHVVFAAGAWTGKLLGELGVKLKVTRQVLGWVWPQKPEIFTPDRFPVWIADADKGAVYYGFPITTDGSGGVGLKAALHFPAMETDPDTVERGMLPGDEEEVRKGFQRFIPQGDGPLLSQRICMYTNTPDGHFVVDRHPECARATIACGFSGHGFKFASVMGAILADLATEGKTDWPIGFLGLSRFTE
ncbi:MAG: N-methyl-L-tryptophan oxidase [Verrucomicrobiota bacterium]|nr:N-methyl-L-tryptophan oxidase [Verrucomicrobiota bacterium]